ncbi:hypothetical protein COEX109129_22475 [Corallococcus exiguus]
MRLAGVDGGAASFGFALEVAGVPLRAYRSASICCTPWWDGSSSRISLLAAMARGRKPSFAKPSAADWYAETARSR